MVEVVDGAGTTSTQIKNRYSHGGQVDEPLSLEVFNSNGSFDQAYTYHADHLGSIRFITDSVGEIVNAYDYDSYGRPRLTFETVDQPFRYTGREFDEASELYHYRARQYDPETGRFLQEDPIGFLVGHDHPVRYRYSKPNFLGFSQALNGISITSFGPEFNLSLYRYVENNPINLKDPSGLIGISFSGLNSDRALKTKSQIYFMLGIAEHIAFKQTVALVIRLEAAKAATASAAIYGANFARANVDCAALILAGIAKSGLGTDTAGAEDDAFNRKRQICYSIGQIAGSITGFFSGGT